MLRLKSYEFTAKVCPIQARAVPTIHPTAHQRHLETAFLKAAPTLYVNTRGNFVSSRGEARATQALGSVYWTAVVLQLALQQAGGSRTECPLLCCSTNFLLPGDYKTEPGEDLLKAVAPFSLDSDVHRIWTARRNGSSSSRWRRRSTGCERQEEEKKKQRSMFHLAKRSLYCPPLGGRVSARRAAARTPGKESESSLTEEAPPAAYLRVRVYTSSTRLLRPHTYARHVAGHSLPNSGPPARTPKRNPSVTWTPERIPPVSDSIEHVLVEYKVFGTGVSEFVKVFCIRHSKYKTIWSFEMGQLAVSKIQIQVFFHGLSCQEYLISGPWEKRRAWKQRKDWHSPCVITSCRLSVGKKNRDLRWLYKRARISPSQGARANNRRLSSCIYLRKRVFFSAEYFCFVYQSRGASNCLNVKAGRWLLFSYAAFMNRSSFFFSFSITS